MDHYQAPQSAVRVSFQTRVAQFFRRLGLRTTHVRSGKKKVVNSSTDPVMTEVNGDRPRPHSVDIIRKTTSPIIGYRISDTSNPTDTDDSSQDIPSCDTTASDLRQPRRHSTYDQLSRTASVHSFSNSRHFVGGQTISESTPCEHDGGPILSFQPNSSTGAVQARSADHDVSAGLQSPGSGPSQHHAGFGHVPCSDATQSPLALQSTASSDRTIATTATDPPPSTGVLLPVISPDTSSSVLQSELAAQKAKAPESVQHREAGPSLMISLPAPFRVVTERGAKMSPSVITRQPLPILNLPPLPVPTSSISSSSRPRVRLRSVPSLSIDGRGSMNLEASNDTASISTSEGDESEEDDFEMINPTDVHQSDDEAEEESHHTGSSTQLHGNLAVGGSVAGLPSSPSPPDYFSSKMYYNPTQSSSPSPSTPRSFTPKTPFSEAMNRLNVQNNASAGPSRIRSSSSELRPSLYRVASRSMVDISRHDHDRVRTSTAPSITSNAAHSDAEETSESDQTEALIGRLLRRNSMPNYYHPASDPPPYPSFDPRPRVLHEGVVHISMQFREDVGWERLPPYSNSLYLTAVMPRKMEFTAPGVQAKDRKWRRVLCELEGTAFRVYNCPPGASGVGILSSWWEKRVGAGDVAVSGTTSHHQRPPARRSEERRKSTKLGFDQPETPTAIIPREEASGLVRRSESQSSRGTEVNAMSSRAARRASGASFLSSLRSVATGVQGSRPQSQEPSASQLTPSDSTRRIELIPVDSRDGHSAESSMSHAAHNDRSSTPVPTTHQPRSASRLSFLPSGRPRIASVGTVEPPNPSKCDLIRAYTLQNAESGLGNDYIKRKNVIRVRLEGEQFLLQAPDVPSVVEWIEGLHAGTNIALDLDHRTMPRGPMFPRRRRRRNRRMRAEESHQSSSAEAVSAMRMA